MMKKSSKKRIKKPLSKQQIRRRTKQKIIDNIDERNIPLLPQIRELNFLYQEKTKFTDYEIGLIDIEGSYEFKPKSNLILTIFALFPFFVMLVYLLIGDDRDNISAIYNFIIISICFIGLSNGFKTLYFQYRTLVLRENLLYYLVV